MEIAKVDAQVNAGAAQGHVQEPLRFSNETLLVTSACQKRGGRG